MFDGLLKSKFFTKCKSEIKLIRARIEIIKKRRNAIQKFMRNDIADLLRNGLDVIAFGRAEGLCAEMNGSQCYEFIDQYCEHISKNLSVMNKQRECPEECREATSGVMFAAARIADPTQLRELRTMFSERYGNSLDYYVNKQFAEKLKSDPPSKDMKLQLLQEIAAESGLEWDSKALENKLFNESAYDKNLGKETNKTDRSSHNHMNGSTQKAATGYEYRHVREETPERKKDLSFDERKQTARNEDRLPRKKKSAANPRDGIGINPPAKVKDVQVDTVNRTEKTKEAMPERKITKENDAHEPLKPRSIPPPYTKPEVNKAKISSSDDSDSTNDKVESTEPADSEEDQDAVLRAKVMGRSVRTRLPKPSPGQEVAGGNGIEKVKEKNKENIAQSRKVLKFLDGGHDQRDEEEKIMDRLLKHYSRKKGSNKNGRPEAELKPTSQHAPMDSSKVKNLSNQDGHARASSFRVEPTSPTETPKKHSRAASFHPDLLNGNAHVHPKLPDYDEFVARLAAFRGK